MPNENLLAITPIDGRYESRTNCLSDYFSEFALIKTRVEVEINWLILISNNKSLTFIPNLSLAQQKKVLNIFNEFSIQDAREIKKIEKKTNHDVKAIELFIVAKLKKLKLNKLCEFDKVFFLINSSSERRPITPWTSFVSFSLNSLIFFVS